MNPYLHDGRYMCNPCFGREPFGHPLRPLNRIQEEHSEILPRLNMSLSAVCSYQKSVADV